MVLNGQNEKLRLESLKRYDLIGSQEESELNELTELAATICGVPIALITIIDEDTQWFKSKFGIEGEKTERNVSFCQYTILQDELFEVVDAHKDVRFYDNPFVTGDPHVRFYLGAPLINESGCKLGSLCVIDRIPRTLTEVQKNALRILSHQVVNNFELRKKKKLLESNKTLLEELVQERTSQLDRFVYSASHELRSPLKSILGLTSIAKEELKNNALDVQSHYLFLIEKSTLKLDATIGHLIEVNENIEKEVEITEVDLQALFQEIAEEQSLSSASLQEQFEIQIDQSCPFHTDKMRIGIILRNLLSNAFKFRDFSKECHKVSILGRVDASTCLIRIADNGIGIEEDHLKHIFNVFFKVNCEIEGVGLGLYIVQEALGRLNGTCRISSVFGQGTTVELQFPSQLFLSTKEG